MLYTYGDTTWGDLMTTYDGNWIHYDGVGNPDTDGTWDYTWRNGRELASMSNGSTTWTFTYNADGIRTKKTDGTTVYKYTYNGSTLTQLDVGSNRLFFVYDGTSPTAVVFNNATYYYVTNLQGDIIALLDNSGTKVVEYTYDAWGNILSTTGSMASTLGVLNPLRYRGYVYDTETGLYYLQSRYYNPAMGRFVNADNIDCLGAGSNFTSYNLFAYCGNNPVMGYDPTGHWDWGTAISGAGLLMVGVTALAAAATILTCGAAAPLMVAVATITATAGALTAINGVAEIVEAGTGYNVVRDGVFNGDTQAYETYRDVTATVAEIGTSICGAYYAANGGNVCFVAGTLVQAEQGEIPIETVSVGTMVWAWDEETGDVALKEVVETYVNESDELVHLFVNGEEIITTPEHPFYSPVKGWTEAARLRAGDILVLVNGEYVVVEMVQHEILEVPITVYNFQVEDYHTYYVADSGVLVHNSCNHGREWNNERRRFWRNQGRNSIENGDYGSYVATTENIARMRRGSAPIGWDGFSVELHHVEGIANNFANYVPVSKTLHDAIHIFS